MRSFSAAARMRSRWPRLLAAPLGLALLAIAACNGTAVVTVTATPSTDTFIAYRVALDSVLLQTPDGKKALTVLPAGTTVDFVNLLDLSEVLGIPTAAKGTYTSAVITLDYSAAQIIYDDGSVDGLQLSPVNASGQAVGQIAVTATLDPSNPVRVAAKQAAQLALNFNLAATNIVNVSAQTVTITPMFAASSLPIDTKQVLIRGPLVGVNSSSQLFTTGIMPFGGTVGGLGELAIAATAATTYEINGFSATGATGLAQIGALSAGSPIVTYGTLTSSTTTTNTAVPVSFAASQVLAGRSVQAPGIDRVSGVVSARSGNTLAIEDGTLIASDGSNTFIPGTSIIAVGPNTAVTILGQGGVNANSPQQISVGSTVDAFGTATATSSGITLDASAGRVRLDPTIAAGLVTVQGNGGLSVDLGLLGGRSVNVFDFVGTSAAPTQYSVNTGGLDLANSAAGAPVVVSGFPNSFGVASPDFIATSLLDPTTIPAELVVDWGAGTAAPFTTFDSVGITIDVLNTSIGLRHQMQVGSQAINILGLSTDPQIAPATGSTSIFSIGHSSSGTTESFNTYANFITQLQSELNGTVLATGITAVGQYTASTFAFSATSITLFLNN
ncbi:MAG TPA: hypothetical protein VNZ02_08830 [Steroidobacteraceae bacterium]|nr:hypothetical protein [Steroidobacteraceae bacterium]